nr:helix-turn-helix transcriptional regulator [Mycolicibacterium chubuense]
MIVAVDDAHLLDDLSMFAVQQLVLRGVARVLLTVRDGETAQAVTALWTGGSLQRLQVGPLTRADYASLLGQNLGGRADPASVDRLWRLTKGNVLYLRHVVDSEIAAGRITSVNGMWLWDDDFVASSSLAELVEGRMGSLPQELAEVVDLLALGEPLSLSTLGRLVDTGALERAEQRRLVTIDVEARDPVVRLAHPLYGEIRKATAGVMRLRRLRGRLAVSLAELGEVDQRALLRRAVLALDSDLAPDVALLMRAAQIAVWLSDPGLALRLSHAAVAHGGGWVAELGYATCLMTVGEIEDAQILLGAVATSAEVPDDVRFQADFLRAWTLHTGGRPEDARSVMQHAEQVHSGPTARASFAALSASMYACRADLAEAVEAADDALASPALPDIARILALIAKAGALADTGRNDELPVLYEEARRLAETSSEAVTPLATFIEIYAWGQRLAGRFGDAVTAVESLRGYSEGPLAHIWTQSMAGCNELATGRAEAAIRRFEAIGGERRPFDSLGWTYRYHIDLVTAYAIAGHDATAVSLLEQLERHHHSVFEYHTPARLLARAWVRASQGWSSGAIQQARSAAELASARSQLAQEVMCLQTATRFGDAGTTQRLRILATMIDGPRASAAAAHAQALSANDATALESVATRYEAMGDLLSAADAAAQACIVHTDAERAREARACAAQAREWARECGRVHTPALAEIGRDRGLTHRQREVIAMAAKGLSNREIARRLSVSVRTVEGHLYRASVRVDATGRAELAARLRNENGSEHQRRDSPQL